MVRTGIISNTLGVLLLVIGGMMLTALPFSIYFEDGASLAILEAGILTMLFGGGALYYKFKNREKIGKR